MRYMLQASRQSVEAGRDGSKDRSRPATKDSSRQVRDHYIDKTLFILLSYSHPHVPVFFWSNRHNFRDIDLKFCIFLNMKKP